MRFRSPHPELSQCPPEGPPSIPLDQTDSRLFNTYGGYVFLQVPHELFPMYFFLPLFGSFDVFLLQGGEYLGEIMV